MFYNDTITFTAIIDIDTRQSDIINIDDLQITKGRCPVDECSDRDEMSISSCDILIDQLGCKHDLVKKCCKACRDVCLDHISKAVCDEWLTELGCELKIVQDKCCKTYADRIDGFYTEWTEWVKR